MLRALIRRALRRQRTEQKGVKPEETRDHLPGLVIGDDLVFRLGIKDAEFFDGLVRDRTDDRVVIAIHEMDNRVRAWKDSILQTPLEVTQRAAEI